MLIFILLPLYILPINNLAKISRKCFLEWDIIDDKYCSDRYGIYNSLVGAKNACVADANCGGVNNYKCDNNEDFSLCPKNLEINDASSGSCIYERPSIISNYLYFLPLNNFLGKLFAHR